MELEENNVLSGFHGKFSPYNKAYGFDPSDQYSCMCMESEENN